MFVAEPGKSYRTNSNAVGRDGGSLLKNQSRGSRNEAENVHLRVCQTGFSNLEFPRAKYAFS